MRGTAPVRLVPATSTKSVFVYGAAPAPPPHTALPAPSSALQLICVVLDEPYTTPPDTQPVTAWGKAVMPAAPVAPGGPVAPAGPAAVLCSGPWAAKRPARAKRKTAARFTGSPPGPGKT